MADDLDREIDANYDFFRRNLTAYMSNHAGHYAVLRHQAVVGFFRTVDGAEAEGQARFGDGLYSIQAVRTEPVDLGFFSHAGR